MSTSTFLRNWTRKCTKNLLSAPNFVVFSYLDFLDSVFCVIYKYLDEFFEGKATPCYCITKSEMNGSNGKGSAYNEEIGMSETLHGRKKKLKELISLLQFVEKLLKQQKGVKSGYSFRNQKKAAVHSLGHRWSDCGCDSCISWMKTDDHKLYVVVEETSSQGNCTLQVEDHVFFHLN